MNKRSYSANTAFLDILFNTLLVFAGIAAIALCLINVTKQTKNVEAHAEFIITITWPKESESDVDTYVEDPYGKLVYFQRREDGLMHLDRDDLGKKNDIVYTPFGPIEYNENREIVTLRGTVPGEYVVNVHMYWKCEGDKNKIPVTIQVDKINPFSTVAVKHVVLENSGDEKTGVRFSVNRDGEVTDVNVLEKSLIKSNRVNYNGPGNRNSEDYYPEHSSANDGE